MFNLRINPVISNNGRILDQDIVVSGYHVPAKVSLFVIVLGNCRLFRLQRSEQG